MACACTAIAVDSAPMRYGPGYLEQVQLRDGRRARLFIFGPQHRGNLIRGFERLSSDSRYMRFMSLRPQLSPRELRYLVGTDNHKHLALAAAVESAQGFEGAAIARFVQLAADPGAVEAAITVVDAYQRAGLGTLLMARLAAAAAERGYRRLQAEILGENHAALRLLRSAGGQVTLRREGTVVVASVALQPWAPG